MPILKNTRLYKDIDLDFLPHPLTGDVSTKQNEEAIKRSIRNIILYNLFEKPFMPFFGGNVRRMLFENIVSSTAFELRGLIEDAIKQWEPRANLIDVTVRADEINSGYEATITFSIRNVLNPLKTTVFLQRVR